MSISSNYIKLENKHVEVMSEVYANAWKNPEIPAIQYDEIVRGELLAFKQGKRIAPFDALARILAHVPEMNHAETTLLDVGAASGYYSEVLSIIGFECKYTGLDYSTYFSDLALKLYPEMDFRVGSATELPFEDKSFNMVLHGACVMHVRDLVKAVSEAARVAKSYVIFHRTPIYTDDTPNEAFVKTAYGVPCVEFHRNEKDMLRAFKEAGLFIVNTTDVFMDGNFGHRTYLLGIS